MSEELKCIGCGAPLQSEDKNAPGYVPEHNLFREDVICKRCFRLKTIMKFKMWAWTAMISLIY